jgi:hypothetical protein
MKATPPETPPTDDLLRKLRIPYVQRASLTRGAETQAVFILDLGVQGVFVERPGLPLGETVVVSFQLPGNEIPVVARCRVAWQHESGRNLRSKQLPPGVGLEFVELSDQDRARIRERVEEHYLRGPQARRFLRHWPEAESLSDDPAGPATEP